MNPRPLRPATLIVALAVLLSQAGCSKHATGVTKPPTGAPPNQAVNTPPDTWFAGPDPNDPAAGWLTDPGPFGGRYIQVSDAGGWNDFPGIPNSMFSADSLEILPKDRPERRTFLEVYGDRIWLRQDGDTVRMNSLVIFPSGGSDPDSPYSVLVGRFLLPPWLVGPVLTPGDPNGSPIGFRLRVQVKDMAGRVTLPSESTTYPNYDPESIFSNAAINGYYPQFEAAR